VIQTGSVWYILDHKSEKEKYLNEKGISIKKRKNWSPGSGAASGKYPHCPCLPHLQQFYWCSLLKTESFKHYQVVVLVQ